MEGPDHILSSDEKEMSELVKFKKNYNRWKLLIKKDFKKININESIKLLLVLKKIFILL